jgi:hypothetical protein
MLPKPTAEPAVARTMPIFEAKLPLYDIELSTLNIAAALFSEQHTGDYRSPN